MDAGVVGLQFLLSILPGGSVPLIYGENGQFQMSPGGSSVQGGDPSSGDTDSKEPSISDGSSTPQESKALAETQSPTPPASLRPLVASNKATPSLTRVTKPSVTTTSGSIQELIPSNQVSTSSLRSSLPSKSVSPASFSKSQSVLVSSFHSAPHSSGCVAILGKPCSDTGSATSTSIADVRSVTPVVPAKLSNLGVQSSSWYLGVVFAGVSLLVLSVAIAVFSCRRARRRRMAQSIDVPWATIPGDEEEGRLFFNSRSPSFRGANAVINPGQRDLVHGRSPTRDGRHGVSSWTPGLNARKSKYSLRHHPIPGSRLFSNDLPRPLNTTRFLPSHLIDEELAARADQEDGAHSCFTGRPVRLRKRSRGHLDDTIDVNPYLNPSCESLDPIKNDHNITPIAPTHQPLVDRLRNLGNQGREQLGFWDRLPTPGRDQPKEDIEPWAASFKASLFNAFNTFASGLKSHGENEPDGDNLTQAPKRRFSVRSGSMQPFVRRTPTKSPGWILHEKDDGTGTVQFLPSLEKHYGFSTPTPGRLVPVLSLGTGRGSATYDDEKKSFQRTERLIAPRAPTTAMAHPHHAPSLAKRNPISRESSFYSTSSLTTSKYEPSTTSFNGRLECVPELHHQNSHLDVVVLEPDSLSFRE